MIGKKLGPYEISAKLGEGGMGEVYRATDTKLKREVAIKVLPAAFTEDKERLARFEREAQLLAQLQHPNIAAIYGLEESQSEKALVMELVDGEDLSARIARGPVPLDEALPIARQIAEALEFAHERGIVHRDLKPQNVKLRTDGTVKVLDFGLAKAMDSAAPASATTPATFANSPTLMNSPTLATSHGTQLGMILGTAAYMSPEQAKGLAVDKRADIWSFGVVVYELLTGESLFAADSVPEMLAGVLRSDIDFAALPAETPPGVLHLLRRCLERNPKLRLRDIGEARVAIDAAAQAPAEVASTGPPTAVPMSAAWVRALPWALVLLLGGLALTLWALRRAPAAPMPAGSPVLAIRLPAGMTIPLDDRGIYGQTGVIALAPDGSRIAFVEGIVGKGPLYVRELESPELRRLEGTDGASSPFFSPDGRWIGFFVPGKLRKISVEGGLPVDLADASLDRGGVWLADGSIVFSPAATTGLVRLPPGGGPPHVLTEVDVEHGERSHRWPAALPGGHEVAFTVGTVSSPGNYENSAIDAVDIATQKRRPLFRGASMVRFTPDGLALLGRGGEMLTLPLADAHGQTIEDARQVLRDVAGVRSSGVVHFDVAANGTLMYAERDPHGDELELAWFTRGGESKRLDLPTGQYRVVRFSPDGKRVALAVGPGSGAGGDVWVHDLQSGAINKLTFEGRSWGPAWSRDGQTVAFVTALPTGQEELRSRPADGSREAVTLARFERGKARAPVAWMPDGSLLFWQDGGAGFGGDLLYLPPGGGAERPFAQTPAVELLPSVSPDGRFVAFDVDATGAPEIHVKPFPPSGAEWVLGAGTSLPLFSKDGRSIFYMQGRELMEAPISTSGTFAAGAPHKLYDFPLTAVLRNDTMRGYDSAPDGRFLAPRSTSTEPMNEHLVVVLNWLEKLRHPAAKAGANQ